MQSGQSKRKEGFSYFIRTFGCQMNVADSLNYSRVLESLGLKKAESEDSCDLLVINTCSVRAKAEERAISYIGEVISRRRKLRGEGLNAMGGIAVVGCMATVRGEEIQRRFPEVKLILPAVESERFKEKIIETLPELVREDAEENIAFSSELWEELPTLRPEEKFERFLPIIRGCSDRCTYCIVPRARGGKIRSVAPEEIFRQIELLKASGIKSITFLGQNVCAYGMDIWEKGERNEGWKDVPKGYGFAELMEDVRDRFGASGIWFKFLTSHPRNVSERLVDVIASHECFSRHFHLPLQAGDDKVLRRMGRRYTSEEYLALISMIREKIPEARITTDIIVGFPGEDEEAFERTMEMLRIIRFDAAFTFLYSPRSKTPAEKLADPVPKEEKKRRLHLLISLQNQITLEKGLEKVGEEREVLVEGPATGTVGREKGLLGGRSREEEVVVFRGSVEDIGKIVRVKLIEAHQRSFMGEKI